jgi:predicted metal-dependent hydrolase
MEEKPRQSDLDQSELNRGIGLFNRAHFFDAHEVLEDVWRSVPRDRPSHRRLRLHTQGMVQLAVAFHHASRGNYVGARSVLARALRNLKGADRSFPDLDLDRLRAELEVWQRYLENAAGALDGDVDRRAAPGLPQIRRRG